jgi:hypothetical protein
MPLTESCLGFVFSLKQILALYARLHIIPHIDCFVFKPPFAARLHCLCSIVACCTAALCRVMTRTGRKDVEPWQEQKPASTMRPHRQPKQTFLQRPARARAPHRRSCSRWQIRRQTSAGGGSQVCTVKERLWGKRRKASGNPSPQKRPRISRYGSWPHSVEKVARTEGSALSAACLQRILPSVHYPGQPRGLVVVGLHYHNKLRAGYLRPRTALGRSFQPYLRTSMSSLQNVLRSRCPWHSSFYTRTL